MSYFAPALTKSTGRMYSRHFPFFREVQQQRSLFCRQRARLCTTSPGIPLHGLQTGRGRGEGSVWCGAVHGVLHVCVSEGDSRSLSRGSLTPFRTQL